MWPLTSPRAKRIGDPRKFRSPAKKDFFNTICHERTHALEQQANFPVVRGIRSKPVTSLSVPALDCRLSLHVENVKSGRAHGNAQLVAHLHPHGRLDARHHDTLADLHIEQDFRAELLDHFDYSIEARLVEIGGGLPGEGTPAHAERDLVADMAA